MGNGEEDAVVKGCFTQFHVVALRGPFVGVQVHVSCKLFQQRIDAFLLHLAHHAVEINMVELQEQVGGDEAGKLMVVVLFVYVEQLLVAGRHDGKAILGQPLRQ